MGIVSVALLCLLAVARAYTWLDYYFLSSSLAIPPGYPPKPVHAASCRNHITFVKFALDEYVAKQGDLPWDPSSRPEDLVRRLDGYSDAPGRNCHHGAPDQAVGGWQMVNAPPEVWAALSLDGQRRSTLPVLWCGRQHPQEIPSQRLAILVDFPSRDLLIVGVSEDDLEQALREINARLLERGLQPIPKEIGELK